eukprot:COSAG06_NODE_44493_length_363_cov_0.590909_1_plen_73_part_01
MLWAFLNLAGIGLALDHRVGLSNALVPGPAIAPVVLRLSVRDPDLIHSSARPVCQSNVPDTDAQAAAGWDRAC